MAIINQPDSKMLVALLGRSVPGGLRWRRRRIAESVIQRARACARAGSRASSGSSASSSAGSSTGSCAGASSCATPGTRDYAATAGGDADRPR